jgi:hypothetical protein
MIAVKLRESFDTWQIGRRSEFVDNWLTTVLEDDGNSLHP